MKPLELGEEVMLTGQAAGVAQREGFNPYYGIVVKDLGWGEPDNDPDVWDVIVMWEDGKERKHPRKALKDLKSIGI